MPYSLEIQEQIYIRYSIQESEATRKPYCNKVMTTVILQCFIVVV